MGRLRKNGELLNGSRKRKHNVNKAGSDDDMYRTTCQIKSLGTNQPSQRTTLTRRLKANIYNSLRNKDTLLTENGKISNQQENNQENKIISYEELCSVDTKNDIFNLKSAKLFNGKIRIGENYQADIKPFCFHADCVDLYYENKDLGTLIWDPKICHPDKLEKYMKRINIILKAPIDQGLFYDKFTEGMNALEFQSNNSIPDNIEILHHLLRHNGNINQAIANIESLKLKENKIISHMTTQDCMKFDYGFTIFKKNFSLMAESLFADKTCHQLVEYYYIWKKSENYRKLKVLSVKKKEKAEDSQEEFMTCLISKFDLPYEKVWPFNTYKKKSNV